MVIPLLPIIMAVSSLGLGIAQGVRGMNDAKSQAAQVREQSQEQINERARQAKKLRSMQESSFLKSGVYFEGTPEAVFQETYDTANADMNAIAQDSVSTQKNLIRQGRTGFSQGLLNGLQGGAMMFNAFGGSSSIGNTGGGAGGGTGGIGNSRVGTSFQNWWEKLMGRNRGGFGSGDTRVA